METNIKTSGAVILTDEVRNYITDKLEKLGKVLDEKDTTVIADVEIGSVSNARTGNMFRAEFTIMFTGGMARAEATRETLHAAIDEAVDEARREIRKMRTKHRDLVRRGAAKVKEFFKYFNP